jgi:hypothetical protein
MELYHGKACFEKAPFLLAAAKVGKSHSILESRKLQVLTSEIMRLFVWFFLVVWKHH